jgi:hypothetical protein
MPVPALRRPRARLWVRAKERAFIIGGHDATTAALLHELVAALQRARETEV